MTTYTFEASRMKSRDTDQAIYVRHPLNVLQCFYIPKDAITDMSAIDGGPLWSITIPEKLAEEKGLL